MGASEAINQILSVSRPETDISSAVNVGRTMGGMSAQAGPAAFALDVIKAKQAEDSRRAALAVEQQKARAAGVQKILTEGLAPNANPEAKKAAESLSLILRKDPMLAQAVGLKKDDMSYLDLITAKEAAETTGQPLSALLNSGTNANTITDPMGLQSGSIPQAQYGVTGFSKSGPKFGITPESKIQMNVAEDVLSQREKEMDKRIQAASNSTKDFSKFAKEFQLSQDELIQQYGNTVDEASLAGFGVRQIAKIASQFGSLPETKSFRDSIQSFATPLAKSAGEDRLTNEDIQRFTAILTDTLEAPSEVNATKMRGLLLSWEAKGGDISEIVNTFKQSGGVLKQAALMTENFDQKVQEAGARIDKFKNLSDDELKKIAYGE